MYDLSIFYYGEDCQPWAQYIKEFLPSFEVFLQDILDVLPAPGCSIPPAKAHVVLFSIGLQDYLIENPTHNFNHCIPKPVTRCIVLFLGLTEKDISNEHLKCLPSLKLWRQLFLNEENKNSVKNVLLSIGDIIESYETQVSEPSRRAKRPSLTKQSYHVDSACEPDPPCEEDTYLFHSELSFENEKKCKFTLSPVNVILGDADTVLLIFEEEVTSSPDVTLEIQKPPDRKKVTNLDMINPYVWKMNIPDDLMSGMIGVSVFNGHQYLGNPSLNVVTRTDMLHSLLKQYNTPLQLMAESLGIPSHDIGRLDIRLAEMFEESLPRDIRCFDTSSHFDEKSDKELPTLLHFCARYGLCELCNKLLDCPGIRNLYSIENYQGDYPCQIALKHGHKELSDSIREFMAMEEHVEDFYVQMKEGQRSLSIESGHYDVPPLQSPPMQEDYYLEMNRGHYDVPRGSVTSHGDGYISMTKESENREQGSVYDIPRARTRFLSESHIAEFYASSNSDDDDDVYEKIPHLTRKGRPPLSREAKSEKRTSATRQPPDRVSHSQASTLPRTNTTPDPFFSSADDSSRLVVPDARSLTELRSIMDDYKDGELNEQDVVDLFREWQRRPTPKSFKERQKMLENMKTKLKEPSLFEKIFRGKAAKKKKHKLEAGLSATSNLALGISKHAGKPSSPRSSATSRDSTISCSSIWSNGSRGSNFHDSAIYSETDDVPDNLGDRTIIMAPIDERPREGDGLIYDVVDEADINVHPDPCAGIKKKRKSIRYSKLEESLEIKPPCNVPSIPPRPPVVRKSSGPEVPPRSVTTRLSDNSSPPRPSKPVQHSTFDSVQQSKGLKLPVPQQVRRPSLPNVCQDIPYLYKPAPECEDIPKSRPGPPAPARRK